MEQLSKKFSYNVIQVGDKPNFVGITSGKDKKTMTRLIKEILKYLGYSAKAIDTIKNIQVKEYSNTSLEYHAVNLYDFDIRIFTDLDQYLSDGKSEKNSILKLFKICGLGLFNVDDPLLSKIIKSKSSDTITYGINNPADFTAKDIRYSQYGLNFILDFKGIEKNVRINTFNESIVYDALAAISTCYFLGLPLNLIIDALNHTEIF
ncbi:hypothetical protein I6U48_26820 [Clostridium sp. PL3]|uniref:Mur ligase central domain-containing protein n=1 Tax=Clostridium thailandense TaxID=2794346 RepID=A0A949U4W8_9CLOT|nr:Mur ligase family protein [Clostridium thailandense]MBV7276494.1 hypothetical protein [Clostridium thailandense]